MKRLALLATFALLSFTAAAHAFLGETPAQMDARWGRPLRTTHYNLPRFTGQERVYSSGGMTVTVVFMNGTSHREIYHKPTRWTDAQLANFTRANSGKYGIQVISATPTRTTWSFGSGVYASYTNRPNSAFLTVSTAELARAEGMRTREEWFWRY